MEVIKWTPWKKVVDVPLTQVKKESAELCTQQRSAFETLDVPMPQTSEFVKQIGHGVLRIRNNTSFPVLHVRKAFSFSFWVCPLLERKCSSVRIVFRASIALWKTKQFEGCFHLSLLPVWFEVPVP